MTLTALIAVLIFRFAVAAMSTWEGPVTVTVNELAKEHQDQGLLVLAYAEAKRIASGKEDRIASDAAINWQQKLSDAPSSPSWHVFARELFDAAFPDASFAKKEWNETLKAWRGEYYTDLVKTVPLWLLVFENPPSSEELKSLLMGLDINAETLNDTKIFAVCNTSDSRTPHEVACGTTCINVWPRSALLKKGINLTEYARDLIRRFDAEPLGGTLATLKDTFVETHVVQSGFDTRHLLTDVLSEWITEKGRRQLAITGEYGQGKSTAMLHFCALWAREYLANGALQSRVPMLVELRGKSPAETDILSIWAARYALPAKQVRNLVKAGEAVLIFEGFDELKNAGREYDRHEQFNSLWRLAYPGTKIMFTGRPNFFLDEKEKNRTLRSDITRSASGDAFTEVWQISPLARNEIKDVLNGFSPKLCNSVLAVLDLHPSFLDIISRPSMLPVVATIWDEIEKVYRDGENIDSGTILEYYIQATYRRKEVEVEKKEQFTETAGSADYFLMSREIRHAFTLAVIWRMASTDAKNTISRSAFNEVINETLDDLFKVFQTKGVDKYLTYNIRQFEERFRDETRADKLERISTEVASAGLMVLDPAGGPSNLRLPHKQFYEYRLI